MSVNKSGPRLVPGRIKTRPDGIPPKPLPQWQIPLIKVAFGLSFLMVAIGIAGIVVLTDKEQTAWISQSLFGRLYRRLIEFNPFFQPALVNGGILLGIFSFIKLRNNEEAIEIALQQRIVVENLRKQPKWAEGAKLINKQQSKKKD